MKVLKKKSKFKSFPINENFLENLKLLLLFWREDVIKTMDFKCKLGNAKQGTDFLFWSDKLTKKAFIYGFNRTAAV